MTSEPKSTVSSLSDATDALLIQPKLTRKVQRKQKSCNSQAMCIIDDDVFVEILKESRKRSGYKTEEKRKCKEAASWDQTRNVQSHHLQKPPDHSKYQRIQVRMRMEMRWWMNLTVNTRSVEKFLENKALLGYRATTIYEEWYEMECAGIDKL